MKSFKIKAVPFLFGIAIASIYIQSWPLFVYSAVVFGALVLTKQVELW